MKNKIKTLEEIEKISRQLRSQGKIIVVTNGCFDLLHAGHINSFEKAKELGDVLIILLNSDQSVKRFKGEKRPIVPQNQRAKVLAAIENVDYVIIFDEDEPLELIKKIKPHKHLKIGEIIPERFQKEQELMRSLDGERIHFTAEDKFSTTGLIKKILEIYS